MAKHEQAAPVVLVTGCSSGGIGAELCKSLAYRKCKVYASARRIEAMSDLNDYCFGLLTLDVNSPDSINEAINQVMKQTGRIDILINNAGTDCLGPLAEIPMERVRANFETNVFAVIAMAQAVAPIMAKQGGGKIINVGSMVAWVPPPWGGSYCATKAAVHSLTSTLRMELKPFNIDVMLLIPGIVKSNFGKNSQRSLEPEYVELYSKFKDAIVARAAVTESGSSTTAHDLAEKAAEKIVKKKMPTQFIYGGMSTLFWMLSFLPPSVGKFFMEKEFGLRK